MFQLGGTAGNVSSLLSNQFDREEAFFVQKGVIMNINAPRGTNDFYGEYMDRLLDLENQMRCLCDDYGFSEIRTPMFERLELFQRGVGETTDIVQKEMYTFFDKSRDRREFALKPEGTAGVVRAYLEGKMYADVQPTKLYYITPPFVMRSLKQVDFVNFISLVSNYLEPKIRLQMQRL